MKRVAAAVAGPEVLTSPSIRISHGWVRIV